MTKLLEYLYLYAVLILSLIAAYFLAPIPYAMGCEHGDTVRTYVKQCPICPSEAVEIDTCIQDIVVALNNAGIYTWSSCCGHGKFDGHIALNDGRVLIVWPATEETTSRYWGFIEDRSRWWYEQEEFGADLVGSGEALEKNRDWSTDREY